MRTKKGDMVKLCFGSTATLDNPYLSEYQYRVVKTHHPHTITVRSENGSRYTVRSWVRCAEMKEKTQ